MTPDDSNIEDGKYLSFKRNLQDKTLNEKSKVKAQGDRLNVNSQLLFQRLVIAARNISNTTIALLYLLRTYSAYVSMILPTVAPLGHGMRCSNDPPSRTYCTSVVETTSGMFKNRQHSLSWGRYRSFGIVVLSHEY
jgi:hypothetical protein